MIESSANIIDKKYNKINSNFPLSFHLISPIVLEPRTP